ncbi:hypothetical protein [Desulfitobacterium dehalogenans]|uniref:hypothetical protein n=1 Tax=Desulfitobacterium dehalogenans TaxID=36854 RepID=UPI0013053E98|nr:hypothetical protein [Desulfitobacterium dehalogenans]
MRKATLTGLFPRKHPEKALGKPPKDFAFRQRTDSKRAGKQSSRKDCSGVGLETGRFQPAIENKCESSAFEEPIWPGTRLSGGLERLDCSAQLME